MDQLDVADDFGGRNILAGKDDTDVQMSRCGQSQKVGIPGDDHAAFAPGKSQMLKIARAQEAGFGHSRHINTAQPQGSNDEPCDVLIGVEPYLTHLEKT